MGKMNLKAIEGAIKSANTPAPLKKGLIKKYGKQLGLTQKDVDKYMKLTSKAKKVAKKVKAKKKVIKKNPQKDITRHGVTRYIVTALDRKKGMRATISKPLSKAKANEFSKHLKLQMEMLPSEYRWASAIKVEKVKTKKNPAKKGGRGLGGKYKKGAKITKISQLPTGSIIVEDDKHATNLVKIIRQDETGLGRDIVYGTWLTPETGRLGPDEFAIWGYELENGEYFKAVPVKGKAISQYIVTGIVKGVKGRGYIAGPYTSKAKAFEFKEKSEHDMKSGKLFKIFSALKVEKAKSMRDNPGKKLKPTGRKILTYIIEEINLTPVNIQVKARSAVEAIEKALKGTQWEHEPTRSIVIRSEGAFKKNPPRSSGTVIYDRITAIEATKGKKSLWPEEDFRHDFKDGGQVVGLPNGDLLIKKTKGKKLWKNFEYGPEDGTRKNPVGGYSTEGPISIARVKSLYNTTPPLKGHEKIVLRKSDGTVVKIVNINGKLRQVVFHPHRKNIKPSARSKYYVGIKRNKAVKTHALKNPPTKKSHGKLYTSMVGPFSKKAAQEYAEKH